MEEREIGYRDIELIKQLKFHAIIIFICNLFLFTSIVSLIFIIIDIFKIVKVQAFSKTDKIILIICYALSWLTWFGDIILVCAWIWLWVRDDEIKSALRSGSHTVTQ